MNLAYATELSLEQYELFESLLNPPSRTGRPRSVNLMQVWQAILYVLVTGCAWRLLPKEYPPYSTVYYYFRKWRDDGSWKRIHDHLVPWVRVTQDHDPSPSAASLDSQTVPTAVMVHEAVGYDAGKKIKGRKRFTLVDTLGLLMAVRVVAGNVPERVRSQAVAPTGASGTPTLSPTDPHLGRWGVLGERLSALGHRYLSLDFRGGFAS